MNSEIDEFLDQVDQWKFKLHEQLKDMSPAERKSFWKRIHEGACQRGLKVVEPEKAAKRPAKRVRPISGKSQR